MENAVIYARYSSSGQREESIEGQLRDCHDCAQRNGFRVVAEYCDRALTGTSDKRPEFQRMISDSAKGQFAVVLCWKNDRFARNRYDAAIYKAQLKKNGVRIVYAKEAIPEGPEGIILEAVMEGFAEYYSANLSQNVRRGNHESALKLQTVGQRVYGLREGADKRFELDPNTAPIVRRIYEEYAGGKSAKDIIRDLNAAGHRTASGKPFSKSSINHILQNEKYKGVYRYSGVYDEHGIPAIVSPELFDRVQNMIVRHHEAPAAKRDPLDGFLLTGKLFCGECEMMMTGDGGTGKSGKVYSYYICNGRRQHKCKKERAPKQWIEDIIVSDLSQVVQSDEMVNEIADRFMSWQAAQKKDTSELDGMVAKLKQTELAISRNLELVDSGFLSDSVRSHLLDLEAQKADLETCIARERVRISTPVISRDEILLFLLSFRDGDIDDPEYRRFLVDTFLSSAYLYDDGRLIITMNFTGKKNTITRNTAEKAVREGDRLCSSFEQSGAPNAANLNNEVFWLTGILALFRFAQK